MSDPDTLIPVPQKQLDEVLFQHAKYLEGRLEGYWKMQAMAKAHWQKRFDEVVAERDKAKARASAYFGAISEILAGPKQGEPWDTRTWREVCVIAGKALDEPNTGGIDK